METVHDALLEQCFMPLLSLRHQEYDHDFGPFVRGFSDHVYLLESPSIVQWFWSTQRTRVADEIEYGTLQQGWALPKQAILDWQRVEMFLLACYARRALLLWRQGDKRYTKVVALWSRQREFGHEWSYLDKQIMTEYEYKKWLMAFCQWFMRTFPTVDVYDMRDPHMFHGLHTVMDPALNIFSHDVWLHYHPSDDLRPTEGAEHPVLMDLQNRTWQYTDSHVRLSMWLQSVQWVNNAYMFLANGGVETMVHVCTLWVALTDYLTMTSWVVIRHIAEFVHEPTEYWRDSKTNHLLNALRCHALAVGQWPLQVHRMLNYVCGHVCYGFDDDALQRIMVDGLSHGTRPVGPNGVFGIVGHTLFEVELNESFWWEYVKETLEHALMRAYYAGKSKTSMLPWEASVWESHHRGGSRLFMACPLFFVEGTCTVMPPDFTRNAVMVIQGLSMHDALDSQTLDTVLEGKMMDACAILALPYLHAMIADRKVMHMDSLGMVRTQRETKRPFHIETVPFIYRSARYTCQLMNALYYPGWYGVSIQERTWLQRDYLGLASSRRMLRQMLAMIRDDDISMDLWTEMTFRLYTYIYNSSGGRMAGNLMALTRQTTHWLHSFLIQYTYGLQWVDGQVILLWYKAIRGEITPAVFSAQAALYPLRYPLRRVP